MNQKYSQKATQATPALIIYLIDVSRTMEIPIDDKPRIQVVSEALNAARVQMIGYSTKGSFIAPRYRIAFIIYSERAFWVNKKIYDITELAQEGIPRIELRNETNTYDAFLQAEKILKMELPNIQRHPAPMICHITDGRYTGKDPLPVAERIKKVAVNDGNVLIQNIFISDKILREPIPNIEEWPGVTMQTKFTNPYAEVLRSMSSPLPSSYRKNVNKFYAMAEEAVLMIPGTSIELVRLGLVISASTPRTVIK